MVVLKIPLNTLQFTYVEFAPEWKNAVGLSS